jgi:hypothetical protein
MKHRQPMNHNISSTDKICEELEKLAPLYSIGAVMPEERRFVETMLPFCPEAAEEFAQYGALAEGLLFALPQNEAPPSVDKLMARVQQYEESQPKKIVALPVAASPQRGMYRWGFAAAVLIVILFATTNIYWARQVELLRAEQQAMLALLQERPTSSQIALEGNDHHRHLSATSVIEDGSAILIWNSDEQIGTLYADQLPPLPEGQVYQVWLLREGHHITLGTFNVDPNGSGSLVFHSEEPIESFNVIGISAEGAAGADEPTTPHVVVGEI